MREPRLLSLPSGHGLEAFVTGYGGIYHSDRIVSSSLTIAVTEHGVQRLELERAHTLRQGKPDRSSWSAWTTSSDARGRKQYCQVTLDADTYPEAAVEDALGQSGVISPLVLAFAAYELLNLCASTDADLLALAALVFRSRRDLNYIDCGQAGEHEAWRTQTELKMAEAKLSHTLARLG